MADESPETQTPEAPAAPGPETPDGALRLDRDSGASKPGKPLEKGQGKVIVRTRWPVDSFEHGLKDVPAITAHGVEVDRGKAGALNKAAGLAGIELEEVE